MHLPTALTVLLALSASAAAQGGPPRVREAVTTEEVGGFVVLTLFNPGTEPACAITGPMTSPFRIRLFLDRAGTANLDLIDTAWALTPASKASVTFKTGDKTAARAFAVQGGSSATTVLHSYVPKDDPAHDGIVALATAAFTPGASTAVSFADGQSYNFAGPPAEAAEAFRRCVALVNRPL